jgi:hypothetical protein
MREYNSREMPEGFLARGAAVFFGCGWAVGKERILRTSAAEAPDIESNGRETV